MHKSRSCYLGMWPFFWIGRPFKIETDHKPLMPLLSSKNILHIGFSWGWHDSNTPFTMLLGNCCIQQILSLIAADHASHSLQQEVESFIPGVTSSLPTSSNHLETYKTAQDAGQVKTKFILSQCFTTKWGTLSAFKKPFFCTTVGLLYRKPHRKRHWRKSTPGIKVLRSAVGENSCLVASNAWRDWRDGSPVCGMC